LCYPCELSAREELDMRNTIAEAVGVDFVEIHADNDPDDGDGCELVLGLLVDALPPFENRTLPPTSVYFRIGNVRFEVASDAAICGACLPVRFCDGVNGRGIVPIRNLVAIENLPRPLRLIDCEICVEKVELFHRGDCNYSLRGRDSVTVSDAASLVGHLFLSGPNSFDPPCLDACDCDDDGALGISDVVCILDFLFRFGDFPRDPGPGFLSDGTELLPGIDPTPDDLDCRGGAQCI